MAISKDWYHTEMKNDDMEILHRSPSVEYSFYNAVRSGDMETVTANCKNDSFLHLEGTGVLSRNPLTNIKYHFVVTTAMLTVIALTEDWNRSRPIASATSIS